MKVDRPIGMKTWELIHMFVFAFKTHKHSSTLGSVRYPPPQTADYILQRNEVFYCGNSIPDHLDYLVCDTCEI